MLDLEQTVRRGADMIRRLTDWGADPLGLAGSTPAGEPIIAIRQRVARTELAESGSVGATKPRIPQGSMRATCCFITWTALAVRATLH